MNGREMERCPPAVAAAGERCTSVEANALPSYPLIGDTGKAFTAGQPALPQDSVSSPAERRKRKSDTQLPPVAYRAPDGRLWRYGGKRGRVLAMLASGAGVTQWDTYPWHTRLGGIIHAMREDGLAIDIIREGEYRHARYLLMTPLEPVEAEAGR